MDVGAIIGLAVGIPVTLLIGALVGYFVAMKMFKKQMKKNPPISEEQIKMIYSQIGRTPSQTQIKQMMNNIKHKN